jgi:DNA-binding beta-propeller fold protein YncE
MRGLDASRGGGALGPSVFVSYRRDDVPDATDRLTDVLREHLGADRVFMDVDGIEIGADFEAVIGDWVNRCDVLLAVIGHDWLEARSQSGERRIDDPGDYVRLEIEAALNRNIRVIPVLVHGGKIPSSGDLPSSLAPLAKRNAIELTRRHWDLDVAELVNAIERLVGVAVAQPAGAANVGTTEAAKSPAAPSPRRSLIRLGRIGRRTQLVLAAAAVAIVAGAVALVTSLGSSSGTTAVSLIPIVLNDPPEAMTVADGFLWVASINEVIRLSTRTATVVGKPITYTDNRAAVSLALPSGIAVGDGSIWVADGAGNTVTRISERSGDVEGSPIQIRYPQAVAFGYGSVWIAAGAPGGGSGAIWRINAASGKLEGKLGDPGSPAAIAVGDDAVWVANGSAASVSRIDPNTGKVLGSAIQVGILPSGITVGDGSVWVTSELNNTVTRINPTRPDKVVGPPIDVGRGPMGIAVGLGSVWTANYDANTVTRIDASTGKVIARNLSVGATPKVMAASPGAVWVGYQQGDTITHITSVS